MADIASLVLQVVTLVPNIGRDLVQWRNATKDVPARLENLTEDVESAKTLLSSIYKALKHPAPCPTHKFLLSRVRDFHDKLSRLLEDIAMLDPSSATSRMYPLELQKQIDSFVSRSEKIESAMKDITSDPLFQALLHPPAPSPSEASPDCFRVVMDVARNPHDVVLDFDSYDDSGRPLTYEGLFKEAVFNPQNSNTFAVVANGLGGVGKTCALRGIGLLDGTRERFTGGVLFTSIGAEGGLGKLIESISDLVRRAGGIQTALEILDTGTFQHAIERAGAWFEQRPCLFLIDDIWAVNGIASSHVQQLPRLALHAHSRIAYTTGDISISCGHRVTFIRERVAKLWPFFSSARILDVRLLL